MKKLLLGFLAGMVIGGIGVGIYSHHVKERQLASLVFGLHLYRAQAATKTLKMMDQDRFDTVRRLAMMELDDAVDASYQLMVSHQPDLGILAPNLLPGLVEAEEYLEAVSDEAKTLLWLRDVNDYVEEAAKKHDGDAA